MFSFNMSNSHFLSFFLLFLWRKTTATRGCCAAVSLDFLTVTFGKDRPPEVRRPGCQDTWALLAVGLGTEFSRPLQGSFSVLARSPVPGHSLFHRWLCLSPHLSSGPFRCEWFWAVHHRDKDTCCVTGLGHLTLPALKQGWYYHLLLPVTEPLTPGWFWQQILPFD